MERFCEELGSIVADSCTLVDANKYFISALEWINNINSQHKRGQRQDSVQINCAPSTLFRNWEKGTHFDYHQDRLTQSIQLALSQFVLSQFWLGLKQCSLFCLTDFSGLKEIFVGPWDQAMLLLSTRWVRDWGKYIFSLYPDRYLTYSFC